MINFIPESWSLLAHQNIQGFLNVFRQQNNFFKLAALVNDLIYLAKVHSFLKQGFARSALDTIWGYFQLMSAEVSLKVVSSEDRTKHCRINEWIFFQP